MQNRISVVSSYAQDVLVDEEGKILKKQPGGPLPFIQNALEKNKVPYELFFGNELLVEILISKEGEFGRVPSPPPSQDIPTSKLSNLVIISTVLQEWDLKSLSDFKGKIFVDIQGFVRDGGDFGKKKYWNDINMFADKIFCLKGTKEEMLYLPPQFYANQKLRLLIETNGRKEIEIYFQGNKFTVLVREVIETKGDTIGAGDTFFGHFVALLYKNYDVIEAVEEASRKTADFLRNK